MKSFLLASCLLGLCLPLLAAEPVRELSWSELIPANAPPAVVAPAPIHDLSQLADALSESGPAMRQQEPAAPVVTELNGQQIKLPGYIVPLDVNEEGRVTEFLLVPYFGACIHVPPPPSNQIVHVKSELGVMMDALYQPFWVEGPVKVEQSSSELADAGYQLDAQKIYPYELPAS
ncbi:DUF3299 domain-containing protein [Pseudomonas sp. 5P_3.1_Bac2]|uniref:DUF3299 domain-containing protein n=1 Tax=Pseudomonas sp. 5P_3.1_Bac2 TaxID=2971617 RepID=UPI0021C7D004|nr:DUF3299 domain-containing protein [Pseudomonas sp. 5P_3.1_Bac2]MCU1719332.1 DUF3299 domain-containing protein [Pseudomonas sp. 5P_3.1_Bac2]